ncbi:hypothetical protein P0R31_38765 [Bradyrhizobium yuanmingense]|uniref:hypothetical protein n=1 Tax=Bradyrhizobium yuanmingense TaxID=108015 RepID=UPI0023B9CC67|nr:hypothetical protein [Bradyrhizobium yuanmingense]MDF0523162.1 hypothetical protein [Bradyrhizobium yuanmingense]
MTAAKKTSEEAAKKKRQATPGTTAVQDRVVGVPLGHEAQTLAKVLRAYRADPQLVPDMRDNAARSDWLAERGRHAKSLPMWALDYAVAILEQIPQRSPRKPGRPRQDAVESVEFWEHAMSGAEAARFVASMEARPGESKDEIEERAKRLAHLTYRRRRKPDVP